MNSQLRVEKVLNNNIVQVKDGNLEKILIGKGIGFGKKVGQNLDKACLTVGKTFVIEDKHNQNNFQKIVEGEGVQFVDFCEHIIAYISESVEEDLNESIHISLTDHIYATIHRIKLGEPISNPFIEEIETLYTEEFRLAEHVRGMLEKQFSIALPKGEVGFIALHIHSARYNGDVRNALRTNRICKKIVSLLEDELGRTIDPISMDYARFITHIRFMIERINKGQKLNNELTEVILNSFPKSHQLAIKASNIVKEELDIREISKDELAFLTMHIERFL